MASKGDESEQLALCTTRVLLLPVLRLKRNLYFTVSPRWGRRAGRWYLHVSVVPPRLHGVALTTATFMNAGEDACTGSALSVLAECQLTPRTKSSRMDSRTARPRVRDGFRRRREKKRATEKTCAKTFVHLQYYSLICLAHVLRSSFRFEHLALLPAIVGPRVVIIHDTCGS